MCCDSHKYLSLPLIPVEEFLELHPQHRESSEHDLMIARIEHEHVEREKLEQARQELLKRKQALIAENKKRKNDLANLDQDLEKFIDVSSFYSPLSLCCGSLMRLMTYRLLSQFKRSLRRNTKHLHMEVSVRVYWDLIATLHRRFWARYPCFNDLKHFQFDNNTMTPI